MKIVLASASPRRRELLEMCGLEFEIIPDTAGEEVIAPGLTPEQVVSKIAMTKAENVAYTIKSRLNDGANYGIMNDTLIIAADTIVYLDGEPFVKPADESDAAEMLRRLSGRRHTVATGVALIKDDTRVFGAESTDVYFRDLSAGEISTYIKTGEPMDKAGAYGVQGLGSLFIERIEGDFYNVMGLPLCRLGKMLEVFGIFLLRGLKPAK